MERNKKSWATISIVIGPNDMVPLVLDEGKPLPHFWKFPGGRGEPGETVDQTATRETEEEVGLTISQPRLLKAIDRGTHTLYLYGGRVESFDGLKNVGDEGERVALFSLQEILDMVDFFPPHRKILEELGVLITK